MLYFGFILFGLNRVTNILLAFATTGLQMKDVLLFTLLIRDTDY
jgi:hypothetical protein